VTNRQLPLAIITGAASGMGRATALRLVKDGYRVAALDRNLAGLQTLAEVSDGRVIAVEVDLADLSTVESVVGEIVSSLGPVAALVNCAGIGLVATALEGDLASWQRVIDVNLTAPLLVSRAVLPSMLERGEGAIVNVSSVAAVVGVASRAAYCAAKAGLVGLTRSMAADFASRGIRVNALCPGTVETGYTEAVLEVAADPGETYEFMAKRQLIGRMGTAEEMADAIAFLLSGEASFFHGSVVIADGGMTVL
jgi:NAD(P)-dependent dehydrogenase (short-subunit alcohol dehydrogenase family)